MADAVRATLTGDKQLVALCRELPKRVVKKHQRRAVSAGGTPILQAARADAAVESGLLKKALVKKVKTYPSGNAAAIVGANRAKVGEFKGRKRVPAHYIHLVEEGHDGPAPAPAHPFLEPAFESVKAEAVRTTQAKLKAGVEDEARKLSSGVK